MRVNVLKGLQRGPGMGNRRNNKVTGDRARRGSIRSHSDGFGCEWDGAFAGISRQML